MKALFFLLSFTLCLFSSNLVFAQGDPTTETLPTDYKKLNEVLEEIMTSQKRRYATEVFETYEKNVKARKITEQHYYGIIQLGNEMIKRKMKRHNFFQHVLATVNSFSDNNELSVRYFDLWVNISLEILKKQPERKTQKFEEYLKFASSFWETGFLYKISKGSQTWHAISRDFNFLYENDELKIVYNNTRMYCYNKRDSLTIHDAKGTYYPLTNTWKGESGKIIWEQEGIRDAYCMIKDYEINMNNIGFECSNATLYYGSMFPEPIEGTVKDHIAKHKLAISKYPYFQSNSNKIKMSDIGEGLDFLGGFVLEGAKFKGYGEEDRMSTLKINNRKGQYIVNVQSTNFDIKKGERITSTKAAVIIYIHNDDGSLDSIYHPATKFLYSIEERKLTLDISSLNTSVPFFNSLQKVEMAAKVINWQIDTDEINLGDNKQDFSIASENHFDERLIAKYQGITSVNPLIRFATYSETLKRASETPMEVEDSELEEDVCSFRGVIGICDGEMYCEYYPENCEDNVPLPEDVIAARDAELNGALEEETTEPIDPETFDPKIIDINILAKLLDKRLSKVAIVTPSDIKDKIRGKARAKVIERPYDFLDFKRNYGKKYRFGAIDVNDINILIKESNHDASTVLPLILELANDGFVSFNKEDSTVTLKKKLFHYANSVNTLNTDYDFDQIMIKSVPSTNKKELESNAVLNLKEKSVQTNGVQYFTLSRAQQITAEPFGSTVDIKANRDIDFDGSLNAGRAKFTGINFHFIYDEFMVEMDTINYLDLFIVKRQRYPEDYKDEALVGRPMRIPVDPPTSTEAVKSVIEETSGLLFIDDRDNKSGRRESDPLYPWFEAKKKSKVFYSRNNRQGRDIYPRETFYYELNPFKLDKLDSLQPAALHFTGKFYSSNIIPIVEEPLRLMYHDLSLGFEAQTPEGGYPVYLKDDPNKGKGLYNGYFGVSNEGLIGRGTLNYLGATINSDYIEFLPEQFKAEEVDSFNLAKSIINGVEYPKVYGEQVIIDWAPYSDSMYIESDHVDEIPFKFFDSGEYTLDGDITLTPKGLLGNGTFDWKDATMSSNPGGNFIFGSNKVESPSASVIIKSQGEERFAFENDNVKAIIDFDKKMGDFTSNEKDLSTDLPYNSYQTSLDRFHWDMEKNHIYMDAGKGKSGFFLATEAIQDSLFFFGEKADYNLNTGLLKIDGVDFIRVGDAFIYPDSGHIELEQRANMRPISNSKIIADTINKNHTIQRATIAVKNRNSYKADGFLEFNIENFKEQEIKFSDITTKKIQNSNKFETVGSGTVSDSMEFYLDKRTRFKGEVKLNASNKNLLFDGYAKIKSPIIPTQEWFNINSRVDKKNVAIEYNRPENPSGEILHVGLFLNTDSMQLYPTILAPKQSITDRSIFSTTGLFRFDPSAETFSFGDSSKILGDALNGKSFVISEKTGKVNAEGRFDFNKGFNKANLPKATIDCIGNFSFYINKKSSMRLETSLLVDYPIPNALKDILYKDLTSNEETLERILYSSVKNKNIKSHLSQFVEDEKKFNKMWKKLQDNERLLLPNDLEHAFFFLNNPLVWSEKTQSFITKGRMIQMASIGGKHVGQKMQGAIEILMDPARGDAFTFYVVSPNGDWYYFSYQMGFLKTTSSNPNYKDMIAGLKKKDRKIKSTNGAFFEVILASPGEYSKFKNKAAGAHN